MLAFKGINNFTKALTKSVQSIEDNVEAQMSEALDLVEATSQLYVPEDTLATKHSFFREVERGSGYIKGIAGYDRAGEIDYIPLIHANPNGQVWNKATAQDEFLTKGFMENWQAIQQEVLKVTYNE